MEPQDFTRQARVIEVIQTTSLIGSGVPDDPCRELVQYWSKDGELLATFDNWKERQEYDPGRIRYIEHQRELGNIL